MAHMAKKPQREFYLLRNCRRALQRAEQFASENLELGGHGNSFQSCLSTKLLVHAPPSLSAHPAFPPMGQPFERVFATRLSVCGNQAYTDLIGAAMLLAYSVREWHCQT